MTRFAFVDREKAHHDITVLCRLLKVSRSGYYAWRSRPALPRTVADEVLTTQIRTAFEDNRRVYGAPRILPRKRGYPQPSCSRPGSGSAANAWPG